MEGENAQDGAGEQSGAMIHESTGLVNPLEQRIAALESHFAELAGQHATLATLAATQSERLDGHDMELTKLNSGVASIGIATAPTSKEIVDLQSWKAQASIVIGQHAKDIDDHAKLLGATQEKVSNVNAFAGKMSGDLAVVENHPLIKTTATQADAVLKTAKQWFARAFANPN